MSGRLDVSRALPVSSRVWRVVFSLPIPTNCWLVREGDGLTLVDTGYPWSVAGVLAGAQEVGLPIRRIIVTHAHPDHAGALAGLQRATGAPILAHRSEIPFLTGERSMADESGARLCRAVLRAGRRLGVLDSEFVPEVVPLEEGDRVEGLEVLATPGHTPGSLSLWDPREGAVFCGDNLCHTFQVLHLGVPWFTLDGAERDRSLARWMGLPARLVLSGHGAPYRGDVGAALRRLLGSGARAARM